MVDIYQYPKRLENMKEWKIQKAKLKTGKELFQLSKKYFSKRLFGVGKDKEMNIPNDYLEIYADWKERTTPGEDWNEAEEFLASIMTYPNEYYDDLDSVYILIGRRLLLKMEDYFRRENKKTISEAYYGGAYKDYKYAIGEAERYKEYGSEAFEIVARIWTDDLKKSIRKSRLEIEMEKAKKRDLSPMSKSLIASELVRAPTRTFQIKEQIFEEPEEPEELPPLEELGISPEELEQYRQQVEESIQETPERAQGDEEEEKEPEDEPEGAGLDVEDYIRWSKGYINHMKGRKGTVFDPITFRQAFENKMKSGKDEFYNDVEIMYINLSNILKKTALEQSGRFTKLLDNE